jgi:large subunit ribosomal protein L32
MAVPKQKRSKSKARMKRAINMRKVAPAYSQCPNCKAATRPHRACMTCGFYKGRKVVETKFNVETQED